MNKKFLPIISIMAAMALVGCTKKTSSSVEPSSEAPISESVAPSSQTSAASSQQTPASSSQNPTPVSSSSEATDQKTVTVTGMDIVVENSKAYVKISGTVQNVTANDKFAFGLVTVDDQVTGSVAGTWLVGAEEPADADYKYAATITADAFELKVDVSAVEFVGGIYRVVAGPKGAYAEVQIRTGIGTGDAKVNGHRIYFRSDLGCIAADQLPPMALTESFVKLEGEKVYHYIGGELSIPQDEFLAKTPYLNYEQCIKWNANKLDSEKIATIIENGKGYVKVDVTDLGIERYNVKLNLNEAKDVDTQMETVIDTSATPVKLNGKAYYVYADKSKAGNKDYIYGNLGLIIEHYHTVENDGDKVADMQPIKCTDCTDLKGFELHTDDMISGQVPDLNNSNSRLGKGSNKSNKWDITGVEAGEYAIQVRGTVKDAGSSSAHWDGRIDIAEGKPESEHGGTKAGYRYTFNAGEGYVEPTTKKTHAETGLKVKEWAWTEEIGTIMIKEGATEFEMKNMDNGYAWWVEGVRLVRIGNYMAPATNVVFTNDAMKIEAEDYTVRHTIFTNTGEETDYKCTEGGPENLDGSVEEDATVSGGKYVHGLFRQGWNSQKGSNMSGEVQYRIKLAEDTTVKIKAKIKSDMTETKSCLDLKIDGANKGTLNSANEWIDVESGELQLAAGIHTISFVGQQLSPSENYQSVYADIDCFDIVKVA